MAEEPDLTGPIWQTPFGVGPIVVGRPVAIRPGHAVVGTEHMQLHVEGLTITAIPAAGGFLTLSDLPHLASPDLISQTVTYRRSEAKAAEELAATFAARLETEEHRIDRVLARLGVD